MREWPDGDPLFEQEEVMLQCFDVIREELMLYRSENTQNV